MLIFYIAIRTLSFLLRNHAVLQEIIAALLVGFFAYLCIKNLSLAWKVLVLELILDGAGHFFELRGLLLRTWVLGIFGALWLIKKIRTRKKFSVPQKNIRVALGIFGVFLAWSIVNGFLNHHAPNFIIQDTILYLFILLLIPALEFEHAPEPLYVAAIKIFIFGTTLFSLITFALYSLNISVLQDPYYHWFRDVAAGKITDLGAHFFRIVTAEQILFVPIILVLFSMLTKKISNKKIWALLVCSLIVVILNFTRIYFVGLAAGALLLFYRTPAKQWFKVSALTLGVAGLIFFSTHFIASRGQSIGLKLLGVRVAGVKPENDPSGAIRIALLPDIKRIIALHPLFGSGLGQTVTYTDPITHTPQTRTQFDWGYFEMIAELGVLGAASYFALLGAIIYNFSRMAHTPLARGLVAGALALFIINITTPALFQGFGVIYFVFLIVAPRILDTEIID